MTTSKRNTEALKSLSDKRQALESLIRITASIQEQQKSLLELSVASNIKQDFPVSMMSHINLLREKIGNIPITDLLQKLETIEKVTENNLAHIIQLVDVEPEDLDSDLINIELKGNASNEFSVDEFIERIANFKRHTQTSIGLRLILKERNVAIAPFRLPIPQAELNQHIRTLKQKEKRCIKRVRKDIVEIIKDSVKIVEDESISEQMRDCINQIKSEMQDNLSHLDNGGKIDELPTKIENHVLESEIKLQLEIPHAESTEEQNNENGNIKIESSEGIKMESNNSESNTILDSGKKKQKLSLWQVFKLWLSTPWNVSWNSLKETSSKKRNN